MAIYQLEFLKEESEIKALQDRIELVKESNDKVRRGLFARHGELAKMYLELKNDLEIIKQNLCKS
jgi:hypothetical protein